MSTIAQTLATVLVLADAALPSKGHAPSLARSRPLTRMRKRWVEPVNFPCPEDMEKLAGEVAAVNVARNRAFALTLTRGKLTLSEYGATVATGNADSIRKALEDSAPRSNKMARFLAMGDGGDIFSEDPVSMLDAHVAEMHLASMASGRSGSIDGDWADNGERNPVSL